VPNLSLALGSSEVQMIEMAQAYATINSGGYAIHGHGIKKIKAAKTGKILYEYIATPAPRVFRGENIEILTNMMVSVVQYGTGQGAKAGFFTAGKTGTSQDYHDAWFDGFSRDYVAIVWFGNDDNHSMKSVTGGSLPARAWRDIIIAAKSDPTPAPSSLQKDNSGTNDFSNLLGNLISDPLPQESTSSETEDTQNDGMSRFIPKARFTPDSSGDNVGYRRFNN
ncbi:MAG: penicillin-binding transpeptidase domain-containing protein, partial [Pseudomonadota bacterium]